MQASEKKIDMFFAVDPRLPPVLTGDHIKLHQILLNLVGNAIKYVSLSPILLALPLFPLSVSFSPRSPFSCFFYFVFNFHP